MWNEPSKERLSKIPRLYKTEDVPLKDKLIYLHFFIGGCDWYVAEFDGDDIFFGYAILNGDLQNAEWGYISFRELKEIKLQGWLEVDCESEDFWRVRKASEIDRIREAHGWGRSEAMEEGTPAPSPAKMGGEAEPVLKELVEVKSEASRPAGGVSCGLPDPKVIRCL